MAQPLFDEHPLQDYLRQSGELFQPIPGAISDLSGPFLESDDCDDDPVTDLINLWSWLPAPALSLARFLYTVVASVQSQHATLQEFSERFKYDVISSSLLSSSISAPSSTRRRSSPSLDDPPSDDPEPILTTSRPPSSPSPSVIHRSRALSLLLFCLCPISLYLDYFMLYVLMGTLFYYYESYTTASGRLPDFISPAFDSLKDLIVAGHLWDSTVHEAINLLELEECMAPSSPPSSPLRTALHTALQSTQTQSDNVRHVLVGLTSPSSLAQLSEMYAPPSPVKPHTPLHSRSGSAIASSRISAVSTPLSEKRATWSSGISPSYAALANSGSPSRQSLKRWEKRKSDLSSLLIRPSGAAISAPVTPQRTRLLEGVEEETANHLKMSDPSERGVDADSVVPPEERGLFASAALELQRQRRSRGIEAIFSPTTSPPPRYTPISPQPPLSAHITRLWSKSSQSSPTSPRSSFSASRFTAIQMPRHPLSFQSLTLALNGALAARRYAASHLLALRFGNGDNMDDSERGSESYWEDVRAVMALLTGALANATTPLIEALDATERERLRTENPTPTTSRSRSSSLESPIRTSSHHHQEQRRRRQVHRPSSHFASFAPLPSHLARFAAHVDTLTNALDDAREHLESCVASLRDGASTATATTNATHTDNLRNSTQVIDAPALHAYERLRRELGLALRECERGREPLLELLRPPSADEDDEDEEDIPALGLDAESSDSDKDASHARSPSPFSLSSPPLLSVRTDAVLVQGKQHRKQQGDDEEDAEVHGDVLVVGLERLPPPGIEQVFEVDADADGDNRTHRRPRPKLSRAERIAAAKARRAAAPAEVTASGLGLSVIALDHGEDTIGATAEMQPKRWGGPGGDVVQELKDVIWKVGEQRRLREERMQQQEQQQQLLVADAEAAVMVSVTRGDNTVPVVTREPSSLSPTVEDVHTSLPDSDPLPPANIT